jgi:hypothetical protein
MPIPLQTRASKKSIAFLLGFLLLSVFFCFNIVAEDLRVGQMQSSLSSNSLLNHWQFDEGLGSILNDSGVNKNNGTASDVAWVTGKIGKALYFNGKNSSVIMGLTFINSSFSVCAWIKADSTGNSGVVDIISNFIPL